MTHIFVDSSVFFSAVYSAKGHSRDLLIMAAKEEITLVVSQLVIDETRRNIAEVIPEKLLYLDQLLEAIPFEYVRPSKRQVVTATKVTALKDASIVAAAKRAKVDFLVTLDRKHLLGKPEIAEYLDAPIVSPKEAVEALLKRN
jgi:predicted nucleic acid-binding protein